LHYQRPGIPPSSDGRTTDGSLLLDSRSRVSPLAGLSRRLPPDRVSPGTLVRPAAQRPYSVSGVGLGGGVRRWRDTQLSCHIVPRRLDASSVPRQNDCEPRAVSRLVLTYYAPSLRRRCSTEERSRLCERNSSSPEVCGSRPIHSKPETSSLHRRVRGRRLHNRCLRRKPGRRCY